MFVLFRMNNGKHRRVSRRDARLLTKLGRGAIVGVESVSNATAKKIIEPEQPALLDAPVIADNIDSMNLDELRMLADERGVYVHHRSGEERIRAILRGEE